ncbi:MAG TPA: HAMP domain-containing sensor histidine kinase [Streptosporangiaceae bacterium]|nr:HAMP domain-containing sensor histidine kinase [Streptosporangiaceae bacterium]
MRAARSGAAMPRLTRVPRRTIRLRLTLIYGGLFLLSGAGLLLVTYVLVSHRLPAVASARTQDNSPAGGGAMYVVSGGGSCPISTPAYPLDAGQVQAQVGRCLAEQQADELNSLLAESGIALGIMTVASVGLGWLVAGRALRPLRTITGAARSISASNLHARLALAGPDDELKELGDTFDGLLARLEGAFAAQRQFAANASHELRTPLARQRTLIEVALADPEPTVPSLREACGRVLATGEQQERLIEALLTLARSQRGLDRLEFADLAAITSDVVRGQRAEASAREITLDAEAGPAEIGGDGRLLERLVVNLVDNAIRHNVPGGWVTVSTSQPDGPARLRVRNSGPLISPAEAGRLFGPFERLAGSRTAGSGSGLGLSIVSAIAAAHGAWLSAEPLPGGGLDVQVRFPVVSLPPPPPPPPPPPAPPAAELSFSA